MASHVVAPTAPLDVVPYMPLSVTPLPGIALGDKRGSSDGTGLVFPTTPSSVQPLLGTDAELFAACRLPRVADTICLSAWTHYIQGHPVRFVSAPVSLKNAEPARAFCLKEAMSSATPTLDALPIKQLDGVVVDYPVLGVGVDAAANAVCVHAHDLGTNPLFRLPCVRVEFVYNARVRAMPREAEACRLQVSIAVKMEEANLREAIAEFGWKHFQVVDISVVPKAYDAVNTAVPMRCSLVVIPTIGRLEHWAAQLTSAGVQPAQLLARLCVLRSLHAAKVPTMLCPPSTDGFSVPNAEGEMDEPSATVSSSPSPSPSSASWARPSVSPLPPAGPTPPSGLDACTFAEMEELSEWWDTFRPALAQLGHASLFFQVVPLDGGSRVQLVSTKGAGFTTTNVAPRQLLKYNQLPRLAEWCKHREELRADVLRFDAHMQDSLDVCGKPRTFVTFGMYVAEFNSWAAFSNRTLFTAGVALQLSDTAPDAASTTRATVPFYFSIVQAVEAAGAHATTEPGVFEYTIPVVRSEEHNPANSSTSPLGEVPPLLIVCMEQAEREVVTRAMGELHPRFCHK